MVRHRPIGAGLLIACLATISGCSRSAATAGVERPPAVDAAAGQIALAQSADGDFAVDLYAKLAEEHPGDNLLISPFSISSALLMAAEGATGETAEQMGRVLRVPHSLRTADAGTASLPWLLSDLHAGQAAICYRLTPEPDSPELKAKIDRLRGELNAANQETARLNSSDRWQEAEASRANAQKIANELNPLLEQTDQYEWNAANALWAEKSYPFRAAYLDTIHRFYGAVATPVDFKNNPDAARQQINDWVARQTQDRIKDLIGSGSLEARTRLVITDAVYFKGKWLEAFNESSTQTKNFQQADGKSVQVPMMSRYFFGIAGYGALNADGTPFDTPREVPVDMPDNDPSLYPDAHGFTAVRLPYKGDKLFMAVIVPRSADGLAKLEKQLPGKGLRPWLGAIGNRTVDVHLPRFKLNAEYSLAEPLQALGMHRAFKDPIEGDGAEFGRMAASDDPAQRLFIAAVQHKAFVEVSEKGTEAAAATSVSMDKTAAAPPHEPPKMRPFVPVFTADKPFLFAICDNATQTILFLGRVMQPE